MIEARTGQTQGRLSREVFRERFLLRYVDPAYDSERAAILRLEAIAWDAYQQGRKAPHTVAAGAAFADPTYQISTQWLDTHRRLKAAQSRWADPSTPPQVLVIAGGARNDGTCPGEMSKTWRLAGIVCQEVKVQGLHPDLLDLSLLTSEYGRTIHPCKGCLSTAMPLCHWPCSCYPNHALDQADDWMAEIYERWVAAHGVIIVTPTYWYQAPSPLKLMIDRLVCADGGNPDPTRTHGKRASEAKQIEADGWNYPQHLAGRVYGLAVHGDVAGVESLRRNLSDWLDWMGLHDAGSSSRLDRYVGYFEPYWNSHEALDRDTDLQEEVRNVARSVSQTVKAARAGALTLSSGKQRTARPK